MPDPPNQLCSFKPRGTVAYLGSASQPLAPRVLGKYSYCTAARPHLTPEPRTQRDGGNLNNHAWPVVLRGDPKRWGTGLLAALPEYGPTALGVQGSLTPACSL